MGVLDTIKDVATLVQKADNIELNHKILELQQQVGVLLDENRELRAANRVLTERADIQNSLIFKDNMYWRTIDDRVEGPYCSKCWDGEEKLMRLQVLGNEAQYCPLCKISAPGTGTPPPIVQRKMIARSRPLHDW
jgi:regulator of replication initiation timing